MAHDLPGVDYVLPGDVGGGGDRGHGVHVGHSHRLKLRVEEGPRTGKRGRPKILDGKSDFSNPDQGRMSRLDIEPLESEADELVA